MPSRFLLFGLPLQRLWLRVLFVCLWLPQGGLAQDHIVERAWLEDPGRQWQWQDVQKRPFQPYMGMLSEGFGHSVIWLRLRIDPGTHPAPEQDPGHLVLRIRPVYLDDIRVFDPLAPQGTVGVTGDTHHPRLSDDQSLDFLLRIARGTQPRDIWLRVASTSTRQIDVQALNTTDLNRISHTQQLVFAGYVSVVLLFAAWGITYWLFSREHLIGAFGLMQVSALLYALGALGYWRAFWPPHWSASVLDHITSIFSITAVSMAIFFHVLMIREFSPPPWVQQMHWGMLILLPLKLAGMAVGWTLEALRINMFEVALAPVLFFASALLCRGWSAPEPRQRPVLSRPVVIGFYACMVFVLALAGLSGLGLKNGSEIAPYIVQVHGLLTAFLVLLMLQYRAHVMHQQQRDTALALERSLLQAQQDREIREEQDKLLTMLAHEIKTPLATMHMRLDAHANGSREIKQAIRDMNNVIERCLQTARLGDKQLVARIERCDIGALIHDVVLVCPQPGRVDLEMPPDLHMQADRQLLFIVLNNLLENACKYAAPETPIQLKVTPRAQADGTWLQFEVTNQAGPAGQPETDKVFTKYYRSPHARRQAGTGLGLYLVRNLVQVLGGHIDYAPNGTTTRFILQLPNT